MANATFKGFTSSWVKHILHRIQQGDRAYTHRAHKTVVGLLIDISEQLEELMALVVVDQSVIDTFVQNFENVATALATEINDLLAQAQQYPQLDVTGLQTALNDLTALETPQPVATLPAVTGLNPAAGAVAGGTPIVVAGSGFTGATAVNFGTTPATSFTVADDATINAVAPALPAGAVDVTVVTPVGTSAISAADQYTAS